MLTRQSQHSSDQREPSQPSSCHSDLQPQLDAATRAMWVDQLIQLQVKCTLRTESLFVAVMIFDSYLAMKHVKSDSLQIFALTCALLGAKFEEEDPPEIRDFLYVVDQGVSKEEMLRMEMSILSKLGFGFGAATPAHIMRQWAETCDEMHAELARYILEVALLEQTFAIYTPEQQASAAFLLGTILASSASGESSACTCREACDVAHENLAAISSCLEEMWALLAKVDGSPYRASLQKLSHQSVQCVAATHLPKLDSVAVAGFVAAAAGM